jgi:hypothetical protein
MTGRKFNNNGGSGSGKTGTGTPEKKAVVMEFTPNTAGKTQMVTYDTVKEHILQEIQKDLSHGNDIVRCLREGVNKGIPIIKPIREIEVKGSHSEEVLKTIQDGHDMEWKMYLQEYRERLNEYEENIFKTYAIIFGYCNKQMQSRIEDSSEFEVKIQDDPWVLLSTIKLRMYGQVRAKYEYVQPTDTLIQFLNLKQDHGETLGDYAKRFKQSQDNLRGIFGDKMMNDYISKTEKYKATSDVDEQAEMTKGSFKKWCSYVYLRNSDQNKYGSLKKNLQSQFALGNDQYPATVSKVTDVLTNHSWDEAYNAASKKRRESGGDNNKNKTTDTVPKEGAILAMTQEEKKKKLEQATCFCCGELGHLSKVSKARGNTT